MCTRCERDVPVVYVVHSDMMEIEVCEDCGQVAMEMPCKIANPADVAGKLFVNYIQ